MLLSSYVQVSLLLFFLFALTEQQRGRGGGGSFSSGRSSGGFSSSRGGYHGGGYHGGGGAMGGGIGGGICALLCGGGLCYYCCKKRQEEGNQTGGDYHGQPHPPMHGNNQFQHDQFGDGFDNGGGFGGERDPNAEFERLKMIKNRVNPSSMSYDDYESSRNNFISLINNGSSVFTFTQGSNITRVQSPTIFMNQEGDKLHYLELKASDEIGPWMGRGYFMASHNGPYVWWMKDYMDKHSAGQTGDSQFLVYESTMANPGDWAGKWAFEGDENDPFYSGTWALRQGGGGNYF